jgi:hypothetical protein
MPSASGNIVCAAAVTTTVIEADDVCIGHSMEPTEVIKSPTSCNPKQT